MFQKKSEQGRSMVEILGVLAIIGVLSIGGIAGYTLSMRRHRANHIIDLASKLVLVNHSLCLKTFLDNPNSSYNRSCATPISLEEADIGEMPANVLRMFLYTYQFEIDEYINLAVHYDDQKICQAVASAAGTKCTAAGDFYQTLIPFKQK